MDDNIENDRDSIALQPTKGDLSSDSSGALHINEKDNASFVHHDGSSENFPSNYADPFDKGKRPIEIEKEYRTDGLRTTESGDKYRGKFQRFADYAGGVFNLANYIVGAGILGLPYACNKAGLVLGLILVLIVGLAVDVSMGLLLRSSVLAGSATYETLSLASGGPSLAKFTKVFIIIDSMGPLSVYMLVIADSLYLFLKRYVAADSIWLNKPWLAFFQVLVIVVPLCFVQDISRLGWTSLISLLPLVYIMLLQLQNYAEVGVTSDLKAFDKDVFLALPIVVFAYSCQQVMFPIYNEFKEKGGTKGGMTVVVRAALGLSAFSYVWVGLHGYLQYGKDTKSNIMKNFPESPQSDVLWLSMAISILLSYPVIVFPCRISLDRLIYPDRPLTYQRFVFQNIIIVFVAYGIAMLIPSFAHLLGVFGACTSTGIGYILPPLFYLKLCQKHQQIPESVPDRVSESELDKRNQSISDIDPVLGSSASNSQQREEELEAISKNWQTAAWVLGILGGICGALSFVLVLKDFAENPSA